MRRLEAGRALAQTPRFAVVGMGGFARTHLKYMEAAVRAGVAVHAAQVAIPADQKLYAEELAQMKSRGVEVYDSLRQLLADARHRIDVVTVPTGIPQHRPMCQAALEAGCHVIVEKPAAGSIQDVDAMLHASTRAGRLVSVGFQDIYRPEVQKLKAWICAGRFGRVRRIHASGAWPRPPAYYARNGWAGRLAVGDTWVLDSPHQNALAHAVNLMVYLGCQRPGENLRPTALNAELYRGNPIESADSVLLRLETAEGVEVFFAASHCVAETRHPVYCIEADEAVIHRKYQGGTRIVWRDGREETLAEPSGDCGVFEDMAAVLMGRQEALLCPLELARTQVLVTCATFDATAIAPLPAASLQRQENGQVWMPQLDEFLQEAAASGRLLHELGVGWAQSGRRLDMADYGYFPQAGWPPAVG